VASHQVLQARVDGAEDLLSIVKAMKSISAVRIRKFRGAASSLGDYARTLELAFQACLRQRGRVESPLPGPDVPDAPEVAILFGSDQGLAGQFDTRLLELASEHRRLGDDRLHLFTVGARMAQRLRSRGLPVVERFRAPGSVEGVGRVVQDLLVACEAWRETRSVECFTLLYNSPRGGASYEPRLRALLPLDPEWLEQLKVAPWEGPSLPALRTAWATLFEELVREHLYVSLFRACAESVASENASRVAAMEVAESRIEERLSELTRQLNQQRQQAITSELLEIVSGFEALEQERRRVGARSAPGRDEPAGG